MTSTVGIGTFPSNTIAVGSTNVSVAVGVHVGEGVIVNDAVCIAVGVSDGSSVIAANAVAVVRSESKVSDTFGVGGSVLDGGTSVALGFTVCDGVGFAVV